MQDGRHAVRILYPASCILYLFFCGALFAADEAGPVKLPETVWQAPKTYPAPGLESPGLKALFYDGLPWKGKPTRVFAWYGAPKVEPGKKVPAMVLIHGGGGTAFPEWVKLWVDRGYAAISMDTCGCTSGGDHGKRPRHEHGGPPGWGGFDQVDQPLEDQWTYHATAAAILGHSLIRSFPEVDAERIGVTGISWGGYLTCIVAGLDTRFKFAVPVYGCGYLGENSTWAPAIKGMGAKGEKWLRLWDPAPYLKQAALPMLWVTGTNDFAYPMDSLQKSYRSTKSEHTLCVKIRMPHGHGGAGEKPPEIHAFAEQMLNGGKPLAKVTGQGVKDGQAWVTFTSGVPVTKAELCFTKASGKWQDRKWESAPATVDAGKASAPLPDGATVYYINLIDERGLYVSGEHGVKE
jgi:dienelactone hydrolase